MKSPVAGKSGSVRFMHLKPSQLKLAEDHGKRLDERSQARIINQDPPLTTTGLDLVELYERHIAGAKLHGGKKRVIHINFQFPDELVDGDDGPYMLKHACEFVEAIFGDEAIFANRLDRDEKGRKNVDIFVAPKYLKHTAKGSQVWVSTSRDLKELAQAYRPLKDKKGQPITTPRVCGQALQDALHEYFMHVMDLPGVERGSPKLTRGSDWKDAEQLRMEELAEAQAKADALLCDLQNQQDDDAKVRAELEADRNRVRIAIEDAAREKALAASELASAREDAERIRREAEQERQREQEKERKVRAELYDAQVQVLNSAAKATSEAIAERDAAKQIREQLAEQLGNAPQMRRDAAEALEAAEAEQFSAVDERRAAQRLRADVEEEKRSFAEQRDLDQRQYDLLIRASKAEEGLNLRTKGERFEMNEAAMTADEKDAYGRKWSKTLIAMARSLAHMLERLREAAREVFASRQAADSHMAEAKRREVEAEQRERQLAIKRKELTEQKLVFERDKASHLARSEALRRLEASVDAKSDNNRRWGMVIDMVVTTPVMFVISTEGRIGLSDAGRKRAIPALKEQLEIEPPEWVKYVAKRVANAAERGAALSDMIARAGPILSPKQEETVIAAKNMMKQFGILPPGKER